MTGIDWAVLDAHIRELAREEIRAVVAPDDIGALDIPPADTNSDANSDTSDTTEYAIQLGDGTLLVGYNERYEIETVLTWTNRDDVLTELRYTRSRGDAVGIGAYPPPPADLFTAAQLVERTVTVWRVSS